MQGGSININTVTSIYFIGVGGIGMSALARYFHAKGIQVAGYDKTATPLTRSLEEEGIAVVYEDVVALLPEHMDLVIYTPAIPKDHAQYNYLIANNYTVIKRSDALQLITENAFNICVAGTHGKTTTTTMIAHLLRDSGYGCNAFLGGISANYNTNFWSSSNDVCVIEADEYDRSFLKLSPDVAVVTSADADHLDIYGDAESVKEAFVAFTQKIKPGGLLIKKFGIGKAFVADHKWAYSLQNDSADVYATNIKLHDGGYSFDVQLSNAFISGFRLNMGGMHNVENMVAAISVASHLEIDADKIKAAVENFKGVRRRFEYVVKAKNLIFIDDYAHHPEELKALISGVKSLFPEMKCTVIFQPHLFTRTRDFADEFAGVLDEAHQVILLPVYPARELPIEGVSSEMIAGKMASDHVRVLSKEEVLDWVKNDFSINREKEFGEIIITAGAGNIDQLVEPIKEILEN